MVAICQGARGLAGICPDARLRGGNAIKAVLSWIAWKKEIARRKGIETRKAMWPKAIRAGSGRREHCREFQLQEARPRVVKRQRSRYRKSSGGRPAMWRR